MKMGSQGIENESELSITGKEELTEMKVRRETLDVEEKKENRLEENPSFDSQEYIVACVVASLPEDLQ